MSEKQLGTATIEILGKFYAIRCPESDMQSLQQAVDYLNRKMLDVQESGKAINVERIAVITALNIAHQFLELERQKTSLLQKITHHVMRLQDKLETTVQKGRPAELVYVAE